MHTLLKFTTKSLMAPCFQRINSMYTAVSAVIRTHTKNAYGNPHATELAEPSLHLLAWIQSNVNDNKA